MHGGHIASMRSILMSNKQQLWSCTILIVFV